MALIHEMTHILGFDSDLFPYYVSQDGNSFMKSYV